MAQSYGSSDRYFQESVAIRENWCGRSRRPGRLSWPRESDQHQLMGSLRAAMGYRSADIPTMKTVPEFVQVSAASMAGPMCTRIHYQGSAKLPKSALALVTTGRTQTARCGRRYGEKAARAGGQKTMSDRNDIHAQRLLIVDFGSQYTQLIARRIRECGVYCEIYPFDVSAEAINEFAPMGVILLVARSR